MCYNNATHGQKSLGTSHYDCIWESEGKAPHIHFLGIWWKWVVTLTPSVRTMLPTPVSHWMEGWMGPRAGLNIVAKIEIFTQSGSKSLVIQTIASYFSDWAILASKNNEGHWELMTANLDILFTELLCRFTINTADLMHHRTTFCRHHRGVAMRVTRIPLAHWIGRNWLSTSTNRLWKHQISQNWNRMFQALSEGRRWASFSVT